MDQISKASIMKLHSDMVVKNKLAPATANKVYFYHAFNVAMQI